MKALVIGGGLLGISTAYFLGRRGWRVVVVERRHAPGLETSYANGRSAPRLTEAMTGRSPSSGSSSLW